MQMKKQSRLRETVYTFSLKIIIRIHRCSIYTKFEMQVRTCAVADEYSEEFIDIIIEAADYFIQDFTDSMITEF